MWTNIRTQKVEPSSFEVLFDLNIKNMMMPLDVMQELTTIFPFNCWTELDENTKDASMKCECNAYAIDLDPIPKIDYSLPKCTPESYK